MRAQFYIHIGLPKTATTFLQWKVFPRVERVTFLGKAKCLSFYELYGAADDKFLISHEHLLACPWESYGGGWLGEFNRRLDMLAQRFPAAKIMLSFREHEDLLTSYYKEYISKPGRTYLSLEQFFDVRRNAGLIRHEDLAFMDIIESVERRFDERPFVFLFEDVVDRLPDFLSDLALFMEETVPEAGSIERGMVNPGVGYYQAKLLVRLNKLDAALSAVPFVPSLYNPLFAKLSIQPDRLCRKHLAFLSRRPVALTQAQTAFVRGRYREDWKDVLNYVADQRERLGNGEAPTSNEIPTL